MSKQYIVASSSTCGPCHMLKNLIKTNNIEVEIKDYTKPEDIPFFKEYAIKAVPRLVIIEDGTYETIQGVSDIIEALKNREIN